MSSTGWSFTLDLGSWNHPDITKLVHLVVRTVHFLVWKQCCRSPSRSHWRSSLYRLQESESLSFLLSDCFLLAPNRSAPMVKYWRDTSLMALSMKLVTVRGILHPHATSLICQHEASKLPFQFYHREKKKKECTEQLAEVRWRIRAPLKPMGLIGPEAHQINILFLFKFNYDN